jgi:CRP-like cAMP-binding protein
VNKLDESLLTGLPPFSRLSRRQIRDILDLATAHRCYEGKPVFTEGEAATRFFLLLDGYVRVLRITAEGDQIIVLHIVAGQLLGIAAALGRTTYPATAMAAADCVMLAWPMQHWPAFVAQYDGFATETYKVVGARVAEMQGLITDMATKAVEQRIATALLRLVHQTGRKTAEGIEIDFPITRQDISEMTGTTLHTVSRLLSAWEKQGIVASQRRKIVVVAPHKLVVLSGA